MDAEILRSMPRSSLETIVIFFSSIRSARQPEDLIQSLSALSEAVFEKDDAKLLYCGPAKPGCSNRKASHLKKVADSTVPALSRKDNERLYSGCGANTYQWYQTGPVRKVRDSLSHARTNVVLDLDEDRCSGDCKKKNDLCLISLTGDNDLSDSCEQVFNSLLPYISEAFLRFVRNDEKKPEISQSDVQLTPREKEVLTWVSKGKGGWEVGEIVGISERTVKFHLQNIYKKLGVINRAQAVTKAIQCNVLQV